MSDSQSPVRKSPSRQQYLDSLVAPTPERAASITQIQLQREQAIAEKYHQPSPEEHDAARKIQRTYRGHRDRRQLDGLTLDPSSRWVEAIKEMQFRSVSAPHRRPSIRQSLEVPGDTRSSTSPARQNWRRAGQIAEHASGGCESLHKDLQEGCPTPPGSKKDPALGSMLMDLRYFLEMVDLKHRYGANLLVCLSTGAS